MTNEILRLFGVKNPNIPPKSLNGHILRHQGKGTSSHDWRPVVSRYFPELEQIIEILLATVCAALLKDVNGCPALVLVGPPSSQKTTALECMRVDDITYKTDNFTPKSFVSHSANVSRKKLAGEVDLLPRIKHKVIIVKDLAPFFGKRRDDLTEAIGVLTSVLDGTGFSNDSGVHGHRGYEGDYRFVLLAATTPISSSVWEVMEQAGPRLLFYDVPIISHTEDEQIDQMLGRVSYNEKLDECRMAVGNFVSQKWNQHGGFGGMDWDRNSDDREIVRKIVQLTKVGVGLRGRTARERTSPVLNASVYDFTPASIEGPERLRSMIYNLARGNAIANHRNKLVEDDVKLAAKVVISSGPMERRRLLDCVLRHFGDIGSDDAATAIGCSLPTARKVARDMEQLGILTITGTEKVMRMSLAQEHEWIRTLLS